MDAGEGGEEGRFRDLRPGVPFRGVVFALRHVRVNETGPRAAFTLADRDGETRRAVLWEASAEQVARLHGATLVRIAGTPSGPDDRYPNQVTVTAFETVDPRPDRVAAFLPPLPEDHGQTVLRFDRLLASVANPHLSRLLREVFGEERRARFEDAVAAAGHHHARRGGLLRHTVEVAELCRAACRALPFLRHDLLVAGALLHDVGKLFEMRHDLRAGEYTNVGILEGHTTSGAFFVAKLVTEIKGFPPGLHLALRHLILAHHERGEWGAPKAPALPEAVVLAKCDQISAHATEFSEAAASALPGQTTAWRGDGRAVFVGDLGLDALDLGGLPDADLDTPPALTADDLALPPAFAPLVSLPVRGLVAAGDGGRSSEEPEETGERVIVAAPPGGADYVVYVTGESMVGAGILPGDQVCVRHRETALPGEVVIAYVPGSGNVVKRFDVTPAGGFLLSENPDAAAYPPIPVGEGVRVQGVVTRVERDLTARR